MSVADCRLEHVFDIEVLFGADRHIFGPLPGGGQQGYTPAIGGTISGPRLSGRVVPNSGADYAVVRDDGTIELSAHYMLEADDGTIIDPTWTNFADEKRNVATYLGVRFDRTFTIAFTTRTGWASIFNGDATLDHEILRLGLEMHDGTAIGLNKERA